VLWEYRREIQFCLDGERKYMSGILIAAIETSSRYHKTKKGIYWRVVGSTTVGMGMWVQAYRMDWKHWPCQLGPHCTTTTTMVICQSFSVPPFCVTFQDSVL
jgi:hypothetical protein